MLPKNIYCLLKEDPCLSTLVYLIDYAGLKNEICRFSCTTMFAPNNNAFKKLPKSLIDYLLSPQGHEDLVSVLLYHLTSGKKYTNELRNCQMLQMYNQLDTWVIKKNGQVYIKDGKCNLSRIYSSNNETENGSLVDKVCEVLIPGNPICVK